MTVIEKTAFLAAYQDYYKNINPKRKDYIDGVGRLEVLQLMATELEDIDTFFKGLREDTRFTIGGATRSNFDLLKSQGKNTTYNLVKDVFADDSRYNLIGFCASILAPLLAIWVLKYTFTNKLERKIDDAVIIAYQSLAPTITIKDAIAKRTKFFKQNIETLCWRLCNDWDDINDLFFPGLVLKKLIGIKTTGSDFHKKGKQVLILTFKAHAPGANVRRGYGVFSRNVFTIPARQEVRLVYKPSDLELDWRVVGDTNEIQARVPHLSPGNVTTPLATKLVNDPSLFVAINNRLTSHPIPATPPLQLPVYKILPRYPGSSLQVAVNLLPALDDLPAVEAGALPLEFSYGYIEFLTYKPDPPEGNDIQKIADFLDTDPNKWDYVTQDPNEPGAMGAQGRFDLQNYYRIFGWYMALGLILNFGDQHTENLMVHNRTPHLIDLEILFKHRANELAATMLDDHFKSQNPIEQKNALLCKSSLSGINRTMGSQAAIHIVNGFNEAITWITNPNNQNILFNWLNGTNMANVVCRYTPRATRDFVSNFWQIIKKTVDLPVPNPANPVTFNVAPYTSYLERDWYRFYTYNGSALNGRPNFAISHPEHDWTCYLNTDAPVYYRRLGSLDLLNARGKVVNIANPRIHTNPNFQMTLELQPIGDEEGVKSNPAELVIPLNRPLIRESLLIRAAAPGANGLNISVELRNNNSGIANQPMAQVVNIPANGNTEIVITFATDNAAANAPPTLALLANFINTNLQINPHISATLQPNAAVGNTLAVAQPQTFLFWNRNQLEDIPDTLVFPSRDESLSIQARVEGYAGVKISIELKDNTSGQLNQPITKVINQAGDYTEIVITFATNNAGANAPPTLAQLATFINNDPQIKTHVGAALQPLAAVGNTLAVSTYKQSLSLNAPDRSAKFIFPKRGAIEIAPKQEGYDGLKTSVEFRDNTSGALNQAMAGTLTLLGNGTREIAIVFGTDAAGANAPPTLAELVNFINTHVQISALVRANIGSSNSVGNNFAIAQGATKFLNWNAANTAAMTAELSLPANLEVLLLQAQQQQQGNNGLKISVELSNNLSGTPSQAMIGAVTQQPNGDKEIVITFGTNAAGQNAPPTLAQLANLINADANIKALISAKLKPYGTPGYTPVAALGKTSLWARNPSLLPPGTHYFDVDCEGITPAQTPLQISIGRLNSIAGGTTATDIQARTDSEGLPLLKLKTLADVISDFRTIPGLKLTQPSRSNF